MTQMSTSQARVVDAVLTTAAQGYKNADMVGMMLFPYVPVGARGGKIIAFGKEDFRLYNTGRAPGAGTKRVQFGYQAGNYALEQHALEGQLPIEIMQEAQQVPGVNMGIATVNKTQNIIALRLEKAQADLATNPNNYGANNKAALAGTSRWDDYANSDPSADIEAGREAVRSQIGKRPNTVVLGPKVWSKLKYHPKLLDRIKYTGRDSITTDMLAGLWEVPRVVVADAVYADNNDAFADVWGRNVVMAYTEMASVAEMGTPTFGYSYRLGGYPLVEQPYYDRNVKSWIYPVTDEVSPVVAGSSAGFLLSTVVS